MNILVRSPLSRRAEREYILGVLLGERLGLEWSVQFEERQDTVILVGGASLRLSDDLLGRPAREWLANDSLPAASLSDWDTGQFLSPGEARLVRPDLPVLYGAPLEGGAYAAQDSGGIHLGVDVLGTAFFMLTRYEEAVSPVRDKHGRFPASEALAVRCNFEQRPLVDEYVEVLRACLKKIAPALTFLRREFRIVPTHDVDAAYYWLGVSFGSLLHSSVSWGLKHGKPARAAKNLLSWTASRMGRHSGDPYDTFDWIMRTSEKAGVQSAFYFIPRQDTTPHRAWYSLKHPSVRDLLRKIASHGHEIGLHAPYDVGTDAELLASDMQRLVNVCGRAGVRQAAWGGRHHYLRWFGQGGFRCWDAAGLHYDSSLGYAERCGFRCGTCHPFRTFDLSERKILRLVERPLIMMEVSVMSPDYMGLGDDPEAALDKMLLMRRRCALVDGEFVFLWHNSNLSSPVWREMCQTLYSGH